MMTTKDIALGAADCNLAEFQSSTIPRVVKSTMAAESAILSIALDRHLYLRLLMECLMYGEPELGTNWRHKLKIPGTLVTDSTSLYDLYRKLIAEGKYSLVPSAEQQTEESHRQKLRQGQRQRAKERKNAA